MFFSSGGQSSLNLLLLCLLQSSDLLLRGIERHVNLVEGVFRTLLKLLATDLNTLVLPQTRVFLLDLRQSPRLVSGISGLESSLRMAIDLGCVGAASEGEGVESVVDTGCVESSALGGGFVQLR